MPLLPDTSQLKTWSINPRSSFLITESSSEQAAKDFLVNLVDLIRTSNHRILWALRFTGYWKRNLTGLDILRMLVIQSLQINSTALSSKTHPLIMSHFREAVNELAQYSQPRPCQCAVCLYCSRCRSSQLCHRPGSLSSNGLNRGFPEGGDVHGLLNLSSRLQVLTSGTGIE
jgi:hypothetical protein